MNLPPRLKTLFVDFEQAGIRWCLLRLPGQSGGRGGDIDLLMARADLCSAEKVLVAHYFSRLPGWKPAVHFLTFDQPSGQWLWLHIVTELSFGPYELLKTGCEETCLQRRQQDSQEAAVFTLAEEDAFWDLLLHCLVNKGRVAEKHQERLRQLAQPACLNSPLARAVSSALPDGWQTADIVRLAADCEWERLAALSGPLTAAWMRSAKVGPVRLLRAKAASIYHRLRNLRHNQGGSVALLGPDGAGKSTLISGLQETCPLPVAPVYMGLTGGLLPHVNRLWLPFLVIPGRLVVFWGRYLRGRYEQGRGKLVVYDRYIYDWAVPTPYPLTRLQRAYRWIDGHCLPGPDRVLILDAPGEVMFQRKGEYTPEMLEDWRQHFLALRGQVKGCQVVDTTQTAQEVLTEVSEHIWEMVSSRWIETGASKNGAEITR